MPCSGTKKQLPPESFGWKFGTTHGVLSPILMTLDAISAIYTELLTYVVVKQHVHQLDVHVTRISWRVHLLVGACKCATI